MVKLSLALNVVVLVPVCLALITGHPEAARVWGGPSPARGILLSIYLAILCVSAAQLVIMDLRAIAALLLVQVLYKLTTPLTVGSVINPVVISNLLIAALHITTLWVTRSSWWLPRS